MRPNAHVTFFVCNICTTNLFVPCFFQTSGKRNTGLLYVYYAPRTMLSEEHELYTVLTLFAEIGGYVGLLLGVSLWHLATWVVKILQV